MNDIQFLSPNVLKPYENNPRQNGDAVDSVAASIKEFGFRQPIVVDKDMVVVVGHTRLKAAKKLKLKKVHVLVADDLSEEPINDKDELLLSVNKAVCNAIKDLPSVTPKQRVGKWELEEVKDCDGRPYDLKYYCSECGAERPPIWDAYCGSCGCKMEVEE